MLWYWCRITYLVYTITMTKGPTLTKAEFIEQLSVLVSYKTISTDQDTNAQALEYIKSLINPKAQIQIITNGKAQILLAATHETKEPDFGYLVHSDVVAASDDLFSLKQEGSRLMGRGVSDMKYSIPLGIALLNELIETKAETSFTLAITSDEEMGGFDGAAYLAEHIKWSPKALIVPDGGDNLQFITATKGMVRLEVHCKGISAHASRPWDGRNALVPLARLITELDVRYGATGTTETWNTTLNVGQIHGGESTNQVCNNAWAGLDFRFPETDTGTRLVEEVTTLAQSIDSGLIVKQTAYAPPTATDPSTDVVQNLLTSLEKVYQQKIPTTREYGASDARHFAGTPILMIKPHGGGIHQEDEWIDADSVMNFYEGLRRFLIKS